MQEIEDSVYALEWYCLNAANKRTYLMFLVNIMNSYRRKFLIYSVNLELGVAVSYVKRKILDVTRGFRLADKFTESVLFF